MTDRVTGSDAPDADDQSRGGEPRDEPASPTRPMCGRCSGVGLMLGVGLGCRWLLGHASSRDGCFGYQTTGASEENPVRAARDSNALTKKSLRKPWAH
jgi:hypothetical protein